MSHHFITKTNLSQILVIYNPSMKSMNTEWELVKSNLNLNNFILFLKNPKNYIPIKITPDFY